MREQSVPASPHLELHPTANHFLAEDSSQVVYIMVAPVLDYSDWTPTTAVLIQV